AILRLGLVLPGPGVSRKSLDTLFERNPVLPVPSGFQPGETGVSHEQAR
ncbi:MAG: hypothetical protein H3C69_09830, partial [Candidatus Promineofilum sp.]|nr:hypothetical protein [Promineifilum sp.]